jgi:hypothetical protein
MFNILEAWAYYRASSHLQTVSEFGECSRALEILWRNLDTIGITDANHSINDLCPNRFNTYFASNVAQTFVRPALGLN